LAEDTEASVRSLVEQETPDVAGKQEALLKTQIRMRLPASMSMAVSYSPSSRRTRSELVLVVAVFRMVADSKLVQVLSEDSGHDDQHLVELLDQLMVESNQELLKDS